MNSNREMGAANRAGRRLIYVVDDEAMLLNLAQGILEAEGYEVETYRAPSQALRSHHRARRKPDMILTDYQMGNMNGLELTTACRRITPQLKVALVSGTVDAGVFNDVDEWPDRFLAKPYGHRELIELVHQLLG